MTEIMISKSDADERSRIEIIIQFIRMLHFVTSLVLALTVDYNDNSVSIVNTKFFPQLPMNVNEINITLQQIAQ